MRGFATLGLALAAAFWAQAVAAIRSEDSTLASVQDGDEGMSQVEAASLLNDGPTLFDIPGRSNRRAGKGQITFDEKVRCGGAEYVFWKGLSHGVQAFTVLLNTSEAQVPVVAKLTKYKKGEKDGRSDLWKGPAQDLERECVIYQKLKARNVSNTLACVADCELGGHSMIVLTPFVQGEPFVSSWIGGYDNEPFGTDAHPLTGGFDIPKDPRIEQALRMTWSTVLEMLRARIVNRDQQHNILYRTDGTPAFIDMGLAKDIHEDLTTPEEVEAEVRLFLSAIFQLMPPLMLDWVWGSLINTDSLRTIGDPALEGLVTDVWAEWKAREGDMMAEKERSKFPWKKCSNEKRSLKSICRKYPYCKQCLEPEQEQQHGLL